MAAQLSQLTVDLGGCWERQGWLAHGQAVEATYREIDCDLMAWQKPVDKFLDWLTTLCILVVDGLSAWASPLLSGKLTIHKPSA